MAERKVYLDGWGRLTVELAEGDDIEDAYELADRWLEPRGYDCYQAHVTLVPCGINKFREAD